MIFPNVKNLVHTQSNSDTIARWSSITFFLIHPVYYRGDYTHVYTRDYTKILCARPLI
jgi:hypothetical protein